MTFFVVTKSTFSIIKKKDDEVFSKEIIPVSEIKEMLDNLLINDQEVDKVT